jgi:hypothetical protein
MFKAINQENIFNNKRMCLPILPIPMIFLFELSPNLTFPPSFRVREVNLFLSPIICLEHPLLRNHLSLIDMDIKYTYKTISNNLLWYPNFLGSTRVSFWRSSSFDYPNHIFHGTCMNIMP